MQIWKTTNKLLQGVTAGLFVWAISKQSPIIKHLRSEKSPFGATFREPQRIKVLLLLFNILFHFRYILDFIQLNAILGPIFLVPKIKHSCDISLSCGLAPNSFQSYKVDDFIKIGQEITYHRLIVLVFYKTCSIQVRNSRWWTRADDVVCQIIYVAWI